MKTAEREKCSAIVRKCYPYVQRLLVAKAFAQVERERVDKIQRDLLSQQIFYGTNLEGTKYRVTEPRDFRMDEESSTRYFAALNAIHLRNGFADAAKGWCPALVAEREQTKAEWALIQAAEEFFPGTTNDRLLCGHEKDGKRYSGIETRQKFIDLLCGLCVNYPN